MMDIEHVLVYFFGFIIGWALGRIDKEDMKLFRRAWRRTLKKYGLGIKLKRKCGRCGSKKENDRYCIACGMRF